MTGSEHEPRPTSGGQLDRRGHPARHDSQGAIPAGEQGSRSASVPWVAMGLGVFCLCVVIAVGLSMLGPLSALDIYTGARSGRVEPGTPGRLGPPLDPATGSAGLMRGPDAGLTAVTGDVPGSSLPGPGEAPPGAAGLGMGRHGHGGPGSPASDVHARPLSCPGQSSQIAQVGDDGRFFGHLPYFDAPPGSLVAAPGGFGGAGCNQLHGDAAAAVIRMRAAMQAESPELGTRLVGLSCFRSISRQRTVFCSRVANAAGGSALADRARVSAPPGFSEHHTGLAVDFGDRKVPACNLEACFATTPVGKWLLDNARSYGFELSFPAGNAQGVTYEPWHWRHVGSAGVGVFARARGSYAAGGSFGDGSSTQGAALARSQVGPSRQGQPQNARPEPKAPPAPAIPSPSPGPDPLESPPATSPPAQPQSPPLAGRAPGLTDDDTGVLPDPPPQ
jgi:zinc D-Ala-D-Ala carboxypeptidase